MTFTDHTLPASFIAKEYKAVIASLLLSQCKFVLCVTGWDSVKLLYFWKITEVLESIGVKLFHSEVHAPSGMQGATHHPTLNDPS